MKAKPVRHWTVIYYDEQNRENGPRWDVESKILPTRWAKYAFPDTRFEITPLTDEEWEQQEDAQLQQFLAETEEVSA